MATEIIEIPGGRYKSGRYMPQLMAACVLVLMLGLTYVAWASARAAVVQSMQTAFEADVRETVAQVEQRMQAYKQVLRGAQGLLYSSQSITHQAFHDYVAALRLDENYTGLQNLAIVRVVPKADREAHVTAMRESGLPDYHLHPAGEREAYAALTRIEPAGWR